MAKIRVTAVKNTENIYKIFISTDGVVMPDHTLITGAELRTSTGTTLADSDVDPNDWDFTNTGYITVKLGLADIAAGDYTCKLILKDATHSIGLAWDTDILLTVLP